MPPKGMPQPSGVERQRTVEWIDRALDVARSRPTPKNGLVRRLTVAQYRNTLRELLLLDDDLTEILPPDAISKDGFVNNKETLQLSPLLLEAYFEIAEEALLFGAFGRDVGERPGKQGLASARRVEGPGAQPVPSATRIRARPDRPGQVRAKYAKVSASLNFGKCASLIS